MLCSRALVVLALSLGAFSSKSMGSLINVDFVRDSGTPVYTGAGILGSAGQTWNRSTVGQGWLSNGMMAINGLVDSTGTSVAGASFSVNHTNNTVGDHNSRATFFSPNGAAASYAPLFDRYASHNLIRFRFDGLGAGSLHTVVLYQGYGVQNSPSYSVNGVVRGFTYSAATAALVAGRDYLVFENIAADANGRISITAVGGYDSDSGISAIQIESVVPAPGALALLGLAGVTGVRRRR